MINDSKTSFWNRCVNLIAIPIIVLVIGGIILNTTQPKAELKYTLSGKIFISSENKNIQQLEIKNLGKEVAEKIVIDIHGNIKRIEVIKNSEKDIYDEMEIPGGTQINYPELPPMSSIFITIDSVGSESISVVVKHNKGIASAALDSTSASLSSWFLLLAFVFSLILYLYSSIRNSVLNHFTTFTLKYKAEKVLSKRNAPLLIKDNEWKEIREFAFTALQKGIWNNCRKTYGMKEISKFLSEDELGKLMLTKEERKDIIEFSSSTLKLWFDYQMEDAWSKNRYESLLKVEKPALFDEELWIKTRKHVLESFYNNLTKSDYIELDSITYDERYIVLSGSLEYLTDTEQKDFKIKLSKRLIRNLKDEIKDSYLNLKTLNTSKAYICLSNDLSLFYSLDPCFKATLINSFVTLVEQSINSSNVNDLEIFLNSEKPNFLEYSEWDKLIKFAIQSLSQKRQQYLLKNIVAPKETCEEIFELSISDNLSAINLGDTLELAEKLYAKSVLQELLSERDIDYIKENYQIKHIYRWDLIEKILKTTAHAKIFIDIITATKDSLDTLIIPSSIDNYLVDRAKKYVVEKDQLSDEIEKYEGKNTELNIIKNKIIMQLKFIDDLLENPHLIERIEDYEDLFSKGNYNNLNKIFKLSDR